jgi:ABC-type glycerol-3-phosphate transport system substrate-binding protein
LSRRGFVAAGGAALSLSLMAACGDSAPASPTPAPAAQQGSGPTSAAPAGSAGGTKSLTGKVTAWVPASCYLCGAAELWNKSHPEAQVEMVKAGTGGAGEWSGMVVKWQAALRSGQGGADLYQSEPTQIPKNMLHKQLMDWTDRIKDIKKDFVQAKVENVTHPKSQRIYGLPFQFGCQSMFYREDILDKVGYKLDQVQNLTWDSYLELGRKLKKDLNLKLVGAVPSEIGLFHSFLWLLGGSYTSKDGKEVWLDNEKSITAMSRIRQLYAEDLVLEATGNAFWTAVQNGQVAIQPIGSGGDGYINSFITKPEQGLGYWRNAPMPQMFAGGPQANIAGGAPLETPAFSKNPDLIWEFARFAVGSVEGALACMQLGTVLSYVPALKDPRFAQIKLPYRGDWLANQLYAKYAEAVPWTFYFTPVHDEANSILSNSQPDVLSGKVPVDVGMKQIADKVREANKTYIEAMERE